MQIFNRFDMSKRRVRKIVFRKKSFFAQTVLRRCAELRRAEKLRQTRAAVSIVSDGTFSNSKVTTSTVRAKSLTASQIIVFGFEFQNRQPVRSACRTRAKMYERDNPFCWLRWQTFARAVRCRKRRWLNLVKSDS